MFGEPGRRSEKQLEAHGCSAPATVIEIGRYGPNHARESLHGSDYDVILKTKLRVEPAGEPAFEVSGRLAWPADARPVLGSTATVLYDPSDHDKWALDHRERDARSASARDLGATLQQARRGGADPMELARIAMGSGLAAQPAAAMPAPAAPAPPDPLGALTRLADLRDRGVLSEDEFVAQKARILGEA